MKGTAALNDLCGSPFLLLNSVAHIADENQFVIAVTRKIKPSLHSLQSTAVPYSSQGVATNGSAGS